MIYVRCVYGWITTENCSIIFNIAAGSLGVNDFYCVLTMSYGTKVMGFLHAFDIACLFVCVEVNSGFNHSSPSVRKIPLIKFCVINYFLGQLLPLS
jgi:hypothetical protein